MLTLERGTGAELTLERGVWWAPWGNRSGRTLIAVAAGGALVATVEVAAETDAAEVICRVEQLLDMVDPPAAMRGGLTLC